MSKLVNKRQIRIWSEVTHTQRCSTKLIQRSQGQHGQVNALLLDVKLGSLKDLFIYLFFNGKRGEMLHNTLQGQKQPEKQLDIASKCIL